MSDKVGIGEQVGVGLFMLTIQGGAWGLIWWGVLKLLGYGIVSV